VWYEGVPPSEYIAWVYSELVNQGIDVLELPARFRVLKDLNSWRDAFPNDAFARSLCWNSYDLEVLLDRSQATKTIAKPRIEVSAEITTKQNLSVRWNPSGFHEAEDDGNGPMRSYNVLDPNAFREPPDFRQFRGDEQPSFEGRPSNELMFIHGVGLLNPNPKRAGAARHDIIDAMLICAVRATYESLLEAGSTTGFPALANARNCASVKKVALDIGGISPRITAIGPHRRTLVNLRSAQLRSRLHSPLVTFRLKIRIDQPSTANASSIDNPAAHIGHILGLGT
jgi:hypothetical protein